MIVLDIAMFATADVNWQTDIDEYIKGANSHLLNFNMRLNPFPARPANDPNLLSITGAVHDRTPDPGIPPWLLPGDLREACATVLPEPHGIPVIFCKFFRSDAGLAVYQEDKGANKNVAWLNYLLINAAVLNFDRGVLLHELIHCANYVGDIDPLFNRNQHDSDSKSVMRANPVAGVVIEMAEKHAEKLRTAYFARTV